MILRGAVLIMAFALAACARDPVHLEGMALIEGGKVEAGLAKLEEASRREPQRREYRQAYFRQRDLAVQRYLALAETARLQGQWDLAEELDRRTLAIDPQNARAKAGIETAKGARRHRAQLEQAEALLKQGNAGAAESIARTVLAENPGHREARQLLRRAEERSMRAAASAPQLPAALKETITLDFRDATLRQVFEAVSRSTGLNFIFDRDFRPEQRMTIFVRNAAIDDVLRFILVTNQLEKKVLSENTVLVYPNTAAKQRDYQDLVVKAFYLANADVKTTANMIRQLVKTKDLYIDEKLNLLVIRDTPEAVRLAERLVANQDLAEPEVVLEVEVLEVSSNDLHELGVRWPDSVSFSLVGAAGTPGTLTLNELRNLSSDLVRVTVTNPFLAVNLRNVVGRSNLLANPRIRVKNKDKAKVHIGDKVPVITTTTTATGFVSESVTYLDVGLKLDVEPTVFLEDEVGIKIGLEVSSIAREIRSVTGTLTYQVGTRNAATTLRLKDGETQMLAGLISDEDRKSASQIPGLGSIPVLGRLFGSHQDTSNKSEIVLLITPRVVRNLARPELQFSEFASGTEAVIGAHPLLLQASAVAVPVKPEGAPPAGPRVLLQAASSVPPGQEFELEVAVESAVALRSGILDFAFDASRLRFVRAEPGALVAAADKDATFRASAPEGLGRLSVSFTSKADIAGAGELVKLRFQVVETASGPQTIRLEALSFIGAAGQLLAAQPPAPVTVSVSR